LPGVAVTMPWDGTKPSVGGGGGGPPTPEVRPGGAEEPGTVPAGSGDGWCRGGCEGDERFIGNDESGTGADGTGDLASGIVLYVRSGTPGAEEYPAVYWSVPLVTGILPA